MSRLRRWLLRRGSAKMVTRLGGQPYLWRVYLFASRRLQVFWHTFHKDDPDPHHDHPWSWGRIILRGRYREHYLDGTYTDCGPGHVVRWRSGMSFHRVELLTPTVTTIFWHWRRWKTWGFWHPDGYRRASAEGQDGRPYVGTFLPRKLGPVPKEI